MPPPRMASLLMRPLRGGLVWSGAGLGAAWWIPTPLVAAGWIYSTSLITTTACGGALAILLPLGVARGALASVQDVLIEQGHVQRAVQEVLTSYPQQQQQQLQMIEPALWDQLTLGSGWRGSVLRTLASPFLPSTTQMLHRMQQAREAQNPNVAAEAVSGFVEGFLQDQKDTYTMFGLLAYGALLGGGWGLDYFYRRAQQKRQEVLERTKQQREQLRERAQATKERSEKLLQSIREARGIVSKRPEKEEPPEDAVKKNPTTSKVRDFFKSKFPNRKEEDGDKK